MAAEKLNAILEISNSMLDETETEYDTELQYFESLLKLRQTFEEDSKQYLGKAKELLERLQQDYGDGEESGANLKQDGFSESNFQENKESKTQEANKIAEKISQLEEQTDEFNKELSELSEKFKLLDEKKEKLEKESDKFIPRQKDEFSLFSTVTGIRWNFGCNENEIRGYVAGGKEIKPFSVNSDEHDAFHVANYLWDVIESAFEV